VKDRILGRRPDPMRGHRATFNPPHNYTKSKCFLILAMHSGMTYLRLSEETGCPPSSVISSLSRWAKYDAPYVLRRREIRNNRLVFLYKLSARGKRFINERMPASLREELEEELGIGYELDKEQAAEARARLVAALRHLRHGA
jgi:hypothetical protein